MPRSSSRPPTPSPSLPARPIFCPTRRQSSTVRPTLQALPDLEIDVVGRTDDVPIHTAAFSSNLELSLARAARVANERAASDPALRMRTRAAGFGEIRPIAPYTHDGSRARNRRVEIRLTPSDQDGQESTRAAPRTTTP